MMRLVSIGGLGCIWGHRSPAPELAFRRRGLFPVRSSSTDCANSRRTGGPPTSGALFFPQGGEAWLYRVVHTHKTAGSNPAPATSLPALKCLPRACGPP